MKPEANRTFIFPTSRQYPVDEVCERILRALKEVGFLVPGITVQSMRPSWRNVEYVTRITGPDFEIGFEQRDQSCEIAVTSIRIPNRKIWLTGSEQQIYFQTCSDDSDVVACRKNHGAEGLCVYRGSESGRYVQPHEPRLPVYLVATEAAHWLEHGCRSHFLTRDVLSQFSRWLTENVLQPIEASRQSIIPMLVELYSHAAWREIFSDMQPFSVELAEAVEKALKKELNSTRLPRSERRRRKKDREGS